MLAQVLWVYYVLPVVTGIRLSAIACAIIAFSLNVGAFMAEIFRAGILSVEKGQRDAALAIGLTPAQAFRRVVLPQALQNILPASANIWLSLLKDTSIASVISVGEMMYVARSLAVNTYRPVEVLTVAGLIYFLAVYIQSIVIEHLYGRWLTRSRRGEDQRTATSTLDSRLHGTGGARAAMSSAKPVLVVEGLHKHFGPLEVLRGIDLTVQEKEVVALIGPSGSGKSTFLRCLNRLEHPNAGRIALGDIEVTGRRVDLVKVRRHIGMVFQQFNLFPHMSVLENVIEGPVTALKTPRDQARVLGLELLKKVGLADKAEGRPAQLSGGQQQRVAIARALAMHPRIMLFDEPTSALDPELTVEVLNVMKQLADEGMTMIVVSHEMSFVRRVAGRLVMMDEGRIVEQGPPAEVFARPKEERTRRFLQEFQW